MLEMTSSQRRALRAKAHHLAPVVSIGQHGLTPSVQHEIDLALLAHELIKVKVASDDREARGTMLEAVCAALTCAPVQHLGKVFILWRPNPEKKAKAAKRPAAEASAREGTGARKSGRAEASTSASATARPAGRTAKGGGPAARTAKAGPAGRTPNAGGPEPRSQAQSRDESRGSSRRRATTGNGDSQGKERKPAAGGQGLPYFSRRGAGRFVAGTAATPAKPVARRRSRSG